MAENQFSVRVPDLNQAIAGGEEAYSSVQKLMQTRQLTQAREAAAKNVMDGGDLKNSLAMLMGIGDEKGAATLATVMHNQQTGDFQNRQLGQQASQFETSSAETARAHKASEGQAAAALAETKNQHNIALMQPVKIGTDAFGADTYAKRNPATGSYERIDGAALQPRPQAAPQPGQPAPVAGAPTAGGGPAPAPQPQPGQPSSLSGDEFLKTLDPGQAMLVKKIAAYEIDPRTFSTKGGHRERALASVAQFDPSYDAAQFPARQAAVKDFSTGKGGNTMRSFDVAISHIGTMRDLITAMDNRDMPLFNKVANMWKEQTGQTAPGNFDSAKEIVGDEIVKAVLGSGNSALGDREAIKKNINSAGSPAQLMERMNVYEELMAGQLKGVKKQYEDTTGLKNFDNRVSKATRDRLLKGTQQPGAEPQRINSAAERDALAPGTAYIAPDGSRRIKQ